MHKTFALLTALVAAVTATVPVNVLAYNGVVSDVRLGEHPYETRKRDENRRKDIAKYIKKHGYFTFDNPAYLHPIYTKKSVLHPFYRKGGTSVYMDGRFARWRGYLDPVQAHELSPDTYCSNFYYQTLPGNPAPSAYQCF